MGKYYNLENQNDLLVQRQTSRVGIARAERPILTWIYAKLYILALYVQVHYILAVCAHTWRKGEFYVLSCTARSKSES